MKRKAIVVQPTAHATEKTWGDAAEAERRVEKVNNDCLKELNEALADGWIVERETVLPTHVSVSNNVHGYKGLATVIYILVKEEQ